MHTQRCKAFATLLQVKTDTSQMCLRFTGWNLLSRVSSLEASFHCVMFNLAVEINLAVHWNAAPSYSKLSHNLPSVLNFGYFSFLFSAAYCCLWSSACILLSLTRGLCYLRWWQIKKKDLGNSTAPSFPGTPVGKVTMYWKLHCILTQEICVASHFSRLMKLFVYQEWDSNPNCVLFFHIFYMCGLGKGRVSS